VAQQQVAACDHSRTVQVSGTAVINVEPDRVLIQLGVQSNGISSADVQRRNAATISKVKAAIQGKGVAASDITSDNYIIEPIYEDYDSLFIKGYRIYNVLAITLRDVSKASDLIATAFAAGANQVVNVEYYTSNLRTYRDQARDLAMKAAQEKAQALTDAVGSKTGCVLNISENSWSYYSGWGYGNNPSLWTQNVVRMPCRREGSRNWLMRVRSARVISQSRLKFRSPSVCRTDEALNFRTRHTSRLAGVHLTADRL
jgi:uncharacterized protein YggE